MTAPRRPGHPYTPDGRPYGHPEEDEQRIDPPYLQFVLSVTVLKVELNGPDQEPSVVGQTLVEDVVHGIDFWAQGQDQEDATGYTVAKVAIQSGRLITEADDA